MFKETMASSGAQIEFTTGPLYFFDQPTKRIKGARRNILYLNEVNEGAQLEDTTQSRDNDNKEDKGDELTQRLSGETRADGEPDTSSAFGAALNVKDRHPMDAYKRVAPPLLNELARLLSQHQWKAEGCIPHGIVNILNYSWQDLSETAAECSKSAEQTDKRGKSKSSLKLDEARSCQVSANDKREARESKSCVVENVGPSVGRPQVSSNPRLKKRKQKSSRAHRSTTMSFSMSSNTCKNPAGFDLCSGWITQPIQPSCDDPLLISLCQWVVERLQVARNTEKLQTAEEDLNKTLIIRHYGDAKARLKDKGAGSKAQLATLVNGIPQIPEVKQQDPAQQKLHYRINDGSSCIYYPSGCMAVCQSNSGLPCGGFYTTVFSDSECPVVLATITAFGHGAVTHPINSAITAVWDQDGGFICDHHGNVNKEWIWQTERTQREKIVIQLSDLISVRLLSGTSATLTFKCNNEKVQLPLSVVFNTNQSKETFCLQTEGKFASDAAQDLLLARNTKSLSEAQERKRNLTLTPVLQMVREVQELPAQRRRGGHIGRELKRLQQRAQNTLDDWLDYYRVAIGIKCPDIERMPDAPPRTRLRREVQSAALPSLNPPERADAKPVRPEEGRNELQGLYRHLSAPKERPLDSYIKMPRTPKKRTNEEPRIIQIGPLQIHGNIKLESVIIPNRPDLQPSAVIRCPALPSFTPSTPLTVCPPLLRAALLGEGGRRRCCCSATLMPVVTDLEYDAFVMGQPSHSQQILVVCVTLLCQPIHTEAVPDQDVLEQLYRRKNKHRTMPCTQCQRDSFRLVRYEMSTGRHSCGMENILLQQRHNAAPGMVLVSKPTAGLDKGGRLCSVLFFMAPTGWQQQCLPEAEQMYIRGKLLFVGYVFRGHSCSVRDLQKQISRSRGDYRLGLSLPSDYMFSDKVNTPVATFAHNSQDAPKRRR